MTVAAIHKKLRDFALRYPETREDFPWGHTAIKVKGKIFLVMNRQKDEVSVSVKLPQSRDIAADLPFTHPTEYGMGKHGWVTAHITPKNCSMDLLKAWIDESFRAIAPKKVVKELNK